MTSASDRAGLVHVLRALGDGLVEVIVVGGWAHRLHTHHPLATATGNPLHTLDADLFVPAPSRSSAIRVAALVDAGFDVKLGGLDAAPVTEYVLRPGTVAAGGIHKLEFLAHRRGAEVVRGRRRLTTRVGDAVAQLLPLLDVMAHQPWTLNLSDELGYPTGANGLSIRVVAPAVYIAHKLMVLPERGNVVKRIQDVRYLYESLMRFAPALDQLAISWRGRSTSAAEHRRLDAGRRLACSRELVVPAARIRDLDGREAPVDRLGPVIEAGTARLFDG